MYDIIGDIHGHAEALEALLYKMAYKESGGVWQHPERKVIFVPNYFDRQASNGIVDMSNFIPPQ